MATLFRTVYSANGLTTKDATPTTILQFDCRDGEAGLFDVRVIARREDNDAVGAFSKLFVVKRIAGVSSVVGSPGDNANPATLRDTPAMNGTDVTFSFTGVTLNVQVTGLSATVISWMATMSGPFVTK